jgi:hypothetical protein
VFIEKIDRIVDAIDDEDRHFGRLVPLPFRGTVTDGTFDDTNIMLRDFGVQ